MGGQGRAQVGIAFVGANHESAGFGDAEVHAGQARFGFQENFAQVLAGRPGQVGGVADPFGCTQGAVKELAHFFFFQVNGRQHDVAGGLMAKLHDPFSQIGVHDVDVVPFEEGVQAALFGEHGFAFDQPCDAGRLQNFQNDPVMLFGIAGPVHHGSVGHGVFFKLNQIVVQPGKGMGLDIAGNFPQLLPLGHRPGGIVAFFAYVPEGLVMPARSTAVLDECRCKLAMLHNFHLQVFQQYV